MLKDSVSEQNTDLHKQPQNKAAQNQAWRDHFSCSKN